MTIKVDYSETLNSIIDGLIRHNKNEIVGRMLVKGNLSLWDLEDKTILEQRIRSSVEQTAYQVLRQLKIQLGTDLQIIEEGSEVMTDILNEELDKNKDNVFYYEINFYEVGHEKRWSFYIKSEKELNDSEVKVRLETEFLGVDGLEQHHIDNIDSIHQITAEEFTSYSGIEA